MLLRKKALTLLAASLVLTASASLAFAKADLVSIATGGTSGTYYPIGGAIAKAVSTGTNIKASAESSNASVANVNLVYKGDIEVAFTQNDVAYWAYHGQAMFKEPLKGLRAVAALYPEHLQLIVAKDAKIKTIADLKGKRVGIGAPGSGTEADVRAVLGIAKLTNKDMKADFLDFGATTDRFKDNQIDAGFVVAGFPTASIMDLATTKDITLVSFDDAFMAQLVKEHPYFLASVIPAKTYKNVDTDIKTPAVMAILVTSDKLDESVVYEFTKAMFTNIDIVQGSHAKAKDITLENALNGLTVPLHPGAAKFYKEKGMAVK